MKLNHLHLTVPDIKKGRAFYEDFFGFKVYCEEDEGKFLLMRDEAGFVLAIHESNEPANFPQWFHYGFCLDNKEQVKAKYAEMKAAGVEFAREYTEEDTWANFYCWAPGPFKLEVSWHND